MEHNDQAVYYEKNVEEMTGTADRKLEAADPPGRPDRLDDSGNPDPEKEEGPVFRKHHPKGDCDKAGKKSKPLQGVPVVELAEPRAEEGKASRDERVPHGNNEGLGLYRGRGTEVLLVVQPLVAGAAEELVVCDNCTAIRAVPPDLLFAASHPGTIKKITIKSLPC